MKSESEAQLDSTHTHTHTHAHTHTRTHEKGSSVCVCVRVISTIAAHTLHNFLPDFNPDLPFATNFLSLKRFSRSEVRSEVTDGVEDLLV